MSDEQEVVDGEVLHETDSQDDPPDERPVTKSEQLVLMRLPDLEEIERVTGLPAAAIKPSGLELTNPDMTWDEWTALGHGLGFFARWSKFALGDWLIFGQSIFTESDMWSQATEPTTADRYDVANRVTGLEVATLQNYASIAARIPLDVRRIELNFSAHEPVAALPREEQVEWLDRCVENAWTRDELRNEIRQSKNPTSEGDEPPAEPSDRKSIAEQVEDAARLVYSQAQLTSDGSAVVPPEAWRQLGAALGEEL